MKIFCIKPGYEGRTEIVDREYDDRFERDIIVHGYPGFSIYPKMDWIKVQINTLGAK